MTTVNVSESEQHGGFYVIQIFKLSELVSCPEYLTNQNTGLVSFDPEESSVDILPVAESLSISENPDVNGSGILYNISGSMELPYQTSEVDDFLKEYLFKDVVMVGIKHYGQRIMYGSKRHPLRLTYNLVHGKAQEEGTATVIKISGKIPQKPVFLEG